MRDKMSKTRAAGNIAVVLGMTLVLTTPINAQPGPGGSRRRFEGDGPSGLRRGLQELSLTDTQREEIRRIAEMSHDTSALLREQLRAARQALDDATTDEVVNESTIRALAAQMAPLEADAAVQRAHTHSAILMVLTPDQREELRTLREEARERFRERMQRRRGERRQQL